MRENPHSCFSPFSSAGLIRTGVAVLFSAVLAGCAGGGGFGGTADAGNSPNSVAAPVEAASRPISDEERRKVAEAVSRLNFRGAADVAPEDVGVSRSAAILNVNPFAAAAESAEAPTRAEPRKMEGYKAFEFVPSDNPNMTVAVWISETPPEDGGTPEKPGKKLLYVRLQVFISVGNIRLLEGHNVVELESEVIEVEERRPDPPPVVEPETSSVTVTLTLVVPPLSISIRGPTTADPRCVWHDDDIPCVLPPRPQPRTIYVVTVVDAPVTTAPPIVVDDCLGGYGFCGIPPGQPPSDVIIGRTIIILATPDDGMCVSGWTGACAGVGETDCEADEHRPGQPAAAAVGKTGRAGEADERKQCVLVVTPGLDLEAINPVYAPRPTILATVVNTPVTTAPPSPATVAATLECAGGTLPAEGRTQEELDFEFLTASSRHFGWTSDICEWLRRGANVNAKSKPGWDKRGDWRVAKGKSGHTALHLPYLLPHYDSVGIMNLLVEHGAEINARNSAGETPLHMMIRRAPPAHPRNASHFLGFEPDIRVKTNNGQTPLHYAAERGGLEIVKMLLARGAESDLSAQDDDGHTPLALAENHYAELDDSPSAAPHVLHLREYLGKVIAFLRDRTGVYPDNFFAGPLCSAGTLPANGMSQAELNLTLQAAAVAADTAGICEALRRGAEVDARYSGNTTPLGLVAASRNLPDATADAAKMLLANGADPDLHDDDDRWTALHWAIRRSSELMTALLAGGANADVLDKYDWTPLHWAVRLGGESGATRARLLLDGGADVNMRGDDPELSPLDYADQRGSTVVAAVLRDAGGLCFVRTGGLCDAPVVISEDVATVVATVAVTVAAGDGSSCPAGSLPANGLAQIRWNTTLMFSAMLRRLQPACDALRRGAYINVRDTEGRRPLYWAANHGDDAMVSLLIENGADVDVTKNGGVTPLHAAAKRNAPVVVKLLIDGEANVNLKDSTGKTPLHWSALRRTGLLSGADEVAAARLLIDGGAVVNATDNDGGTPLHTAAGSYVPGYVLVNPLALVSLLLANGAEATVTNNDGETALDIARRLGNSDMVAILAPDETPAAPASAEADALADALRKDFAASFNPSPAFGDAFGAVSGSSERFLTRLNSLMRATSGTGGDLWDSFSGWRTENEHGRFWFSTGQRGDFGFGAGGNGAGGDFSASPFAALVGNGMLAGGETGLGADGKLRIAAFADYQAKSLLDGEDKRWTQWAARGTAIETAMTEAERFSGLSENRTRGAMTEIHLGGGDLGVALQAGAVSESDSVLSGTAGNDDLRGLRSRTAFAGLSGAADLFDSGWRLRGSAHLGRSWAESEGLLRDSDLWASAFSAGLERGGWLYSDDGFVLRFSQPLRVESWEMELTDERGGSRLGAGSSGRQLDVDAAYRLPLSGGGWLLLSAGVRRDGGHSSFSDLEAGALFSVERGF